MLDDGSREYLATNLFDPAITKDMFKELYFQRWPVMQISHNRPYADILEMPINFL